MGNDGGSIPDRRDLVKAKPKAEQADKANQVRARWFFCALSKKPLAEPIVSCALGKLYNKDAIIEYLLDKAAYGDGEEICGHIRSLKDVKQLKFTPRTAPAAATDPSSGEPAKFVCPLTFREMNGVQPFSYIHPCGCVFSQSGLRTVTASGSKDKSKDKEGEQFEVCPQCATKFSLVADVFTINPSEEEEEKMRAAMEARRAAEPTKKSKKRKAVAVAADSGTPGVEDSAAPVEKRAKKSSSPTNGTSSSPAPAGGRPVITTASRGLSSSLAAEEAKRKAGMSDAVKSLYHDKNNAPRKETFTTMGTFTRYA
ncbi:DUF602-domain-containing protein [Coniophora puteana RWD-64-598 SS2]|uniref:DUF602-domain-containing protein n=1 Tax=Coniophora puteana (strain RWD-64-598) TaxID=741705 RepID=A0A5M3N3T9_CONPW|nr:DUF602-domain-containing protein [Coniophora puteana RWD-64-598 SS2]EIW86089.1 DUF602-domain-containing protein [Coniophora puteana RWD-64-598 SS2]